MKETVQQYIRRMKGHVGRQNPLQLQAAAPAKLARAIAGLRPAQLRRRPRPGKWSIQEIVAHLADVELVVGFRMRMILAQPGAPIMAFDQDKWAANLGYRREPISALLARIRLLRGENTRLLRRVPRAAWRRYGRHSERGKETLKRTVTMIAGHDLNHLAQIRAIRARFGW